MYKAWHLMSLVPKMYYFNDKLYLHVTTFKKFPTEATQLFTCEF